MCCGTTVFYCSVLCGSVLCVVVPLFSVVVCCVLWCHCFLL